MKGWKVLTHDYRPPVHGLNTGLVRSGDTMLENKGEWVHMRRREPSE